MCVCVHVCVHVCLEFAAFNSRLYIKYDMPFYFSPVFLVLNFVDFDKKPSLSRKSVFHGSLQSLNGSVYYKWSSSFSL